MPNPPIVNAFTVDVEDYFHVQAFADRIDPASWDSYESRVVRNTHRILELLARHGVSATFFVLGWVAQRYPRLVRDIAGAGHEIGCHSYWHQLVYRQTPEAFRTDLRQATDVLQQIRGQAVTAYRAPSFSIVEQSTWALDVLIEEGYRIDSSIFPIRHDTYGMRGVERAPHDIRRPAGVIREYPPAVRRKWSVNIPVGGGGYFRLLPLRLSMRWFRSINRKEGRPVVFYIHPWEVDPDQPSLPASRKSRFRHYRNLHSTADKLDRLLAGLRFGTLSQLDSPAPQHRCLADNAIA